MIVLLTIFIISVCMLKLKSQKITKPANGVTYHPFIGALIYWMGMVNDYPQKVLELSRKNNFKNFELHSLGADIVYIYDKDDINELFGSNWNNYLKNYGDMGFHSSFEELLGNGIFAVDGNKWSVHRKLYSHMFTKKEITRVSDDIFANAAYKLCNDIQEKGNRPFDIQKMMQKITFTTISSVIFGKDVSDSLSMEMFDFLQNNCSYRFFRPPLVNKLMKKFNLGKEKKAKIFAKKFRNQIANIISNNKRGEGMIHFFLEKNKDVTLSELQDLVINILLAGRDTTASALTSFFKIISQQKKFDIDRFLSDRQFARSVVLEVLRMEPPVSVDGRYVEKTTKLSCGLLIRSGTCVLVPIQAMGRDPKKWDNPDMFIPDRFISSKPNVSDQPVFWGGRRSCLGEQMAISQIIIICRAILAKYTITCYEKQYNPLILGPVRQLKFGLMAVNTSYQKT